MNNQLSPKGSGKKMQNSRNDIFMQILSTYYELAINPLTPLASWSFQPPARQGKTSGKIRRPPGWRAQWKKLHSGPEVSTPPRIHDNDNDDDDEHIWIYSLNPSTPDWHSCGCCKASRFHQQQRPQQSCIAGKECESYNKKARSKARLTLCGV